jgi:hypothetical protein
MQFVRTVKTPMPFEEMGWSVIGRKLADAMQGSDLEVYYSLLCATVRRCQKDMERIKPSFPNDIPDELLGLINPPSDIPPPTIIDKVADMTHRGAGL